LMLLAACDHAPRAVSAAKAIARQIAAVSLQSLIPRPPMCFFLFISGPSLGCREACVQ
jgi:hypothetical protein